MKTLNRRRLTDVALFASLTGAWLTHEAGMLIHSLVSLLFTTALIGHAKNNWAVYRSLIKRRTRHGVIDGSISAAMAIVVVTGVVFWITTGELKLGHEPIAIVATVALLAHFWSHRRSMTRMLGIGRNRPAPGPQRRFHLRSKKRKAGATVLVMLLALGIIGYQLASLQFGLEKPSQDTIEAAEADSASSSPPPLITTYKHIDVPVPAVDETEAEHDVSVTVHLRETQNATSNIFLVHGAGGGAWVWEEYFDLLPDDYNLYAISWRGHFTSSPVDDADTSDYVRDQLAALDAIVARNDLPTHVIGHSYGGATSVLATARAPEAVASLHLLAPVVPLDYTFIQAIAVPVILPPILQRSTDAEVQAIDQGTGATGTFTGMFLDQAQMNRYWDLYQGQPYSVEKESLIGGDGISPDWQDELDDAYRTIGEAGLPIWFITARYENVVVPGDQQETADDIGATLIELESGHYIQLDAQADESVDLITRHLG